MQTGFSGNMVQGININVGKDVILDKIHINNIQSNYGPAYGISAWPNSNIEVKSDI